MSKFEMRDGKYVVKLPKPLTLGSDYIDELLLNPDPTCEVMEQAEKETSDLARVLILISELAAVPLPKIKKSHFKNIKIYSEVIEEILGESLETGEN